MNPVAMTIINPQTEDWPSRGSNQRPPVFKSPALQIELLARWVNTDPDCRSTETPVRKEKKSFCANVDLFPCSVSNIVHNRVCNNMGFNSLPNDKNFEVTKLKSFADDK